MATAAELPAVRWSECGAYWYDEGSAEKAVAFFPRYLRFTEGEWAGRPFVLEPWEADDVIRPAFGWKRRDGTRRYRRVIVWVPRKNGKTELAAGVSLLALIADGEQGGQVYAIATDKDQASIVFNKAVAMVNWSPDLSRHLECFKTSIYCAELMASFKPLTGNPEGKHGLSPSGVIGDEVHEWKDGRLYTYVHQGSAARRQPLEFLISTAGVNGSYGHELWEHCQKVIAGTVEDPETLIVIYAADPEDDWTAPETWAKANPNLGISPKREFLEEECRRAQESPRLENDFKRYHLNLWTEQAVRWLPMDHWDQCGGGRRSARWKAFEEMLKGRRCFGGVDLSSTTDLSSEVLWFPPEAGDEPWHLLVRAFVPEDTIAERVRRDRVPYDLWVKEGALQTTPGNVIDYDFIKEQIYRDHETFRVEAMGFDPFLATQLMLQLGAEGINVFKHRQGFLSMSAPSKELERLVLSHGFDHGGHPVARWCAQNVAIDSDPAGNIKPAKNRSTERIDVIVAAINGLGTAMAEHEDDHGGIDAWLESLKATR